MFALLVRTSLAATSRRVQLSLDAAGAAHTADPGGPRTRGPTSEAGTWGICMYIYTYICIPPQKKPTCLQN